MREEDDHLANGNAGALSFGFLLEAALPLVAVVVPHRDPFAPPPLGGELAVQDGASQRSTSRSIPTST